MRRHILDDGQKLREGFCNVYDASESGVLYAIMRNDRESAIFFASKWSPVQYRIHVIPKIGVPQS